MGQFVVLDLDLPPSFSHTIRHAMARPYHFPPSLIYNEGWLLRTLLTWADANRDQAPAPFRFARGATWFSEAALRPPFTEQEGESKADGVIGHFLPRQAVGKGRRKPTISGLTIAPTASQFVVLEAKLGSGLSKGIKHYSRYSQVTRIILCIAEELAWASREAGTPLQPEQFTDGLEFCILAPASQRAQLAPFLDIQRIEDEIYTRGARFSRYDSRHDEWLTRWCRPILEHLAPALIIVPWHQVISDVVAADSSLKLPLWTFYYRCCIARNVIDPHIPPDISCG